MGSSKRSQMVSSWGSHGGHQQHAQNGLQWGLKQCLNEVLNMAASRVLNMVPNWVSMRPLTGSPTGSPWGLQQGLHEASNRVSKKPLTGSPAGSPRGLQQGPQLGLHEASNRVPSWVSMRSSVESQTWSPCYPHPHLQRVQDVVSNRAPSRSPAGPWTGSPWGPQQCFQHSLKWGLLSSLVHSRASNEVPNRGLHWDFLWCLPKQWTFPLEPDSAAGWEDAAGIAGHLHGQFPGAGQEVPLERTDNGGAVSTQLSCCRFHRQTSGTGWY